MSLYKDFVEKFSHVEVITQIRQLLEWDLFTKIPKGGIPGRAKQIAYITNLGHDIVTSDDYGADLKKLVDLESGEPKVGGLTAVEQANLREWAKDYVRLSKLPKTFLEEFELVKSMASDAWLEAKQAADFSIFSPWLRKVVGCHQKMIKYIGYKDHPYDALLNNHESGMTTRVVSDVFSDLRIFLIDLLKRVDGKESPYAAYFEGEFSEESQIRFNKLLLEIMHIDERYARIDVSEHPFCMGYGYDVRLTTNFRHGFTDNIFSVLHEGGHALYTLGLPKTTWPMTTGQDVSMGVHESQSRWWEVMIGRSLPFWEYMYPILQDYFPSFASLSLCDFYKHINHVCPGYIRTSADEVTYPLHVILRFEIEKKLIEEEIDVDDIPKLWNEKMEEFLGITPRNDAEGCLQDIHWTSYLGYFSCYVLGNIYAAQCFVAFESAFPNWKSQVASGSLQFINDWLYESIHKHGRFYSVEQLLERVTGRTLTLEPYKAYLSKKYQPLLDGTFGA